MKTKTIVYSFIGYLLCWGIPQVISGKWGDILFTCFFLVFPSVFLPILLIKKLSIEPEVTGNKKSKMIGILYLGLFLGLSLITSEVLLKVIHMKPSLEVIFKYSLLFLPMSFGITAFCFYLIPMIIEKAVRNRILKKILPVLGSAFCLGLSFYIDTLGNWDMTITMAIMGLFFGVAYLLTKSMLIIWVAFFVNMMFHTLEEAKYYEYPWVILLIEAAIFLLVFLLSMIMSKKNKPTMKKLGL